MKKSSSTNPQKNSPLYNLVFVIVLILTALPFVLFALIQFAPPSFGSSKKTVTADTGTKRMTAEERRAAREEARKAEQQAAAAQRNATPAPVITTTTVTMPGGMGPGMDFGPGGMGGFGGPGGFGGGMDFGPGGMGGFGGF